MNRRTFIWRCFLGAAALGLGKFGLSEWQGKKNFAEAVSNISSEAYYRIVVLGDPHLPVRIRQHKDKAQQEKIMALKNKVIQDINRWEDVAQVSVVGDIAAQTAIPSEYDYARQYFAGLSVPVQLILGNHDYEYEDELSDKGKLQHASAEIQQQKLEAFQQTFSLPSLFYAKQAGRYRLLYLSPDAICGHSTEISEEQLQWLAGELETHKEEPTLIFFHAPLKGTLLPYNKIIDTPSFIAQPVEKLDQLLKLHPQIRLWVSGHTHTPATNESFAATDINTYAGTKVVDIHNSDLDRGMIWTNSLYLYENHIVVKTYNHKTDAWEEALTRTFEL